LSQTAARPSTVAILGFALAAATVTVFSADVAVRVAAFCCLGVTESNGTQCNTHHDAERCANCFSSGERFAGKRTR